MNMLVLLAVGLGGGFGTMARLGISIWVFSILPQQAYLATLAANILGAALIGYLAARKLPSLWQAFLMAGFCGGFTTFSLFSLEVVRLWGTSALHGAGYAIASLVLWTVAVCVGNGLGRARAAK